MLFLNIYQCCTILMNTNRSNRKSKSSLMMLTQVTTEQILFYDVTAVF